MEYVLIARRAQLGHTGYFARPLIELWGEGKLIIEGLLGAFSQYGASFSDIRVESASLNPADQVVGVTIGLNGIHRFRYDRIESTFSNFSDEFLARIPGIIDSSTSWIRQAVPTMNFSAHHFVYWAHANVSNSVGSHVLKEIGPKAPTAGGNDRGSGVIFHWDVPERQWTTQLMIDRSLALEDGLFVMFTLRVASDAIDYDAVAKDGKDYLETVLRELRLRFVQ